MSVGDVLNPTRPRLQANERLDQVDADAVSSAARVHLDAYARAVEAAPRNVGSTTPTGFIFQGFGLTLNPTAPSDAKVRVQAPTGVAFDANGRLLVKESGVQVDLTLPAGNSQIYAYFVESGSDVAVRRAISAALPFVEGSQTIPTKIKGAVGFFVRAGDQTSIVASDVVSGATTALCFLGVASNSAGAVTMTGYNATTAPNGAFATNRIASVTVPATLPVANTMNGSVTTTHGLVSALAYMVGQAVWKGTAGTPPSAANNFQAWTTHPTNSIATLSEYLAAGNLVGDHTISGTLVVGGQPMTFASRSFTADSTTDQLTMTAHGIATGDGPFQTSTTGSLPGELAAVTNYWGIRIDADHVKLARSLLNAIVGLAIDLTSNGTGTHTIAGASPTHAADIAGSRSLSVSGALSTGCALTVGGLAVSFGPSTFTANAALDELTVIGHGLNTGDGPLQVSNSSGALPAPLSAVTNYRAIRTSEDKFKLATSLASALAGTAVDLTTNGTGTNTVTAVSATRAASIAVHGDAVVDGNLTVGQLRATTVAPGENVTMNGGRVAFTAAAPASMTISGALARVSVPGGGDTGPSLSIDGISGPAFIKVGGGATNGKIYYHFALPVGAHLQSWSMMLFKGTNSAQTITATLLRAAFTIANQVGTVRTNTANSPGLTTIGESALDHPIVVGNDYYVEVGNPTSGLGAGTDLTLEMTLTWT